VIRLCLFNRKVAVQVVEQRFLLSALPLQVPGIVEWINDDDIIYKQEK
jgi:hypothetical protein